MQEKEETFDKYRYTDMFGVEFDFLLNKKRKFSTGLGTLFTLTYILITFALFFGFGLDLYQRRNPKVNFNSEVGSYKSFNLINDNFILAYRIENYLGAKIDEKELIYLDVNYFMYELDDQGQWQAKKGEALEVKRCSLLPNFKQREEYYNISLDQWNCLDFYNLTLGGGWDGNFVSGITIISRQCINQTSCLPHEEIKSKFQSPFTSSMYFSSYLYMDALPTMENETQPLRTTLINRYEMLDLRFTKRHVQSFKEVQINDDKGWLFQNIEQNSIFSSDITFNDFSSKDETKQNILFNYFLYFGKKVESYNRSYIKVQEVFAFIGGFSKVFYTFLLIFFRHFSITLRNLKLMSLFEFDVDYDKESKNLSSKNLSNSDVILHNFNKQTEAPVQARNQKLHYHSYYKYLLYKCRGRKKFENEYNHLINYKYCQKYFEKSFDVITYIKSLHEVNLLKKILLNSHQNKLLKLMKPKLFKPQNVLRGNKEIIHDLANLFRNEININDKTRKMLDLLDKDVRNLIMKDNLNK